MADITNVIDRLITVIKAISPATRYHAPEFRHDPGAYNPEELLRTDDATRMFGLFPDGNRQELGAIGSGGSPVETLQSLQFATVYDHPGDERALELLKIVAQDADTISRAVENPVNYDQANSGIYRVQAQPYVLTSDPGSGGGTLMQMTLDVQYWDGTG